MNIDHFLTLAYWNSLAKPHLPELVLILTAAVVTLLDRYVRRQLGKAIAARSGAFRFLVFLLVCTVGYAFLTLGTAWLLRSGLTMHKGLYMAPVAAGILFIVSIEAFRQHQV